MSPVEPGGDCPDDPAATRTPQGSPVEPGGDCPDDPAATRTPQGSPVEPGTGWPDDPATSQTPVARSASDVRQLATTAGTLGELVARQSVCRACPRLVSWREQVATEKRRSFRAERYWGRPIPGWGDARPGVAIVGLAPAAHGGNRTGRIFTGDRSGDVLFGSLYRCGLAARPDSVAAGDGQRLIGARMLAAVRCAPPANKPTPAERDNCLPYLERELELLAGCRTILALGSFGWDGALRALRATGVEIPRPRPRFGHLAEASVGEWTLVGSYHPSQQNTFTGRLTEPMLDAAISRALDLSR
jgi:uracil-DNA glycosylase